jgi:hypothetical protein
MSQGAKNIDEQAPHEWLKLRELQETNNRQVDPKDKKLLKFKRL